MKKINSYFTILISAFCILNFIGCATIPTQELALTYYLNGTNYISLVSFCNSRNINLDYDTFSQRVVISDNQHRINLRVGDNLALIDGSPEYLTHPVDLYQGAIVVPYKFKERFLDQLFKQAYPVTRSELLLLKIKKIVIDPGHGGNDPGTIGRSGLKEKDVNLDIAKRLTNTLIAKGVKVIMTRSTDRFVELSRRAEIANDARADLFISIHSNANRARSLHGFEVYYVSPNLNDSSRAYEAAKDIALNLDSSCFASSSLDLKATLLDMIYTSSRAESVELSHALCKSMDENLNTRILGVKGARFQVLRGTYMPAVLVEVGFLSNYNEEHMLKSGAYRQKVAEALAKGIEEYAQEALIMEASSK